VRSGGRGSGGGGELIGVASAAARGRRGGGDVWLRETRKGKGKGKGKGRWLEWERGGWAALLRFASKWGLFPEFFKLH